MITAYPRQRDASYPLSSSQSRIWFMEKLDKGNAAYNIPLDFRITGDLDPGLLQQSIGILIARHDALRTIFPNGNGHPSQRVLPALPAPVSIIHLEDEPADRKEKIIARHSLDNAIRKFDLGKGPLFSFKLLVLGNSEYMFLVNFHHIISDATSVGIFLEELRTVYSALAADQPVQLPELPVAYTDYAVWEQQWMAGEEYRKQLDYWKRELSGSPDQLQIPTDFRRPKMQTYQGTEYHFTIDGPLREKLAGLSKKHGTSLFVPLLTAFGVLMSRYSSQDDLVIGVPVANRMHAELESVIGVLINSLPLRLVLPEGMTFAGAIGHVKKKFNTGFENQEVAFERLVEELKVKRNTGAAPVFQVLFNYLTAYNREIRMPGFTMQMIHGERRSSQLDLTLSLNDEKTSLGGTVEYNTDLFRPDTIERLAGHYLTILRAVCENEELDLREIPLLTAAEEIQHLQTWNDTAVPYPADRCTHHLFEDQVKRTPDAIALEDDFRRLTYAGLNAQANKLAHYLVKQGVGEDTFAAVYLDRTADLIISMLAIAKAGGTSVPLDPIFPKGRLELILADARPVILITQRSLQQDVPGSDAKVIVVDGDNLYDNEPEENLGRGNPDKAAYALFTSGSTGKPKGVLVRHNSTVNTILSLTKLMEVKNTDVLLAIATFTFDVAESEMYLPLFNGAKLVVAGQRTVLDIGLLKNRIRESEATLLIATPVTFKMLMLSGWEGKADLRVLCCGEGLAKDLARDILEKCKTVFNGYAPTETTIYSLIRKVGPEDLEGDGYVLLGRPIDNTLLYVLNSKRIPVPVGIPGELYIGGDGVSNGYLNLPEHTRERFVTDPLGRDPGKVFYKSGDLVNYTVTGDVNFLNRIDFQVKIRGFRIELGEIESVIALYEGIRENVVVVKKDPTGEKMLTAYLVLKENFQVSYHELRHFLKQRLPDYMVPSAFVTLEKFPLTGTLKVDRNALPEPEGMAASDAGEYVEPSTPTEKKLARIWSSLLNIKKIGIHDDFFEIGGHSMVAVALVVKIEKELGVRIPLATLFDRSTIFHLAELVDKGPETIEWRSLVPIRPAGTKKPLFLVHGMGLNVLLYTTVVNYLDPDQPVYGLQAKGLNGVEEPLDTMESIAAHYISEIMSVDSEGPFAMAGFSLGGRIAYEMARQLTSMGKKVSFLGLFDASADESFAHLPLLERSRHKALHLANYVAWNISNFFREKNESKVAILKRRWKGLEKKIIGLDFKVDKDDIVSEGKRSELPRYLRKVHKANSRADRNYVIKEYPGEVHLFKAKIQTFYITDPVNYGWDKVAKGGVRIHEIPGEHSNTFAPPNDKYFASVLQKHLNERT